MWKYALKCIKGSSMRSRVFNANLCSEAMVAIVTTYDNTIMTFQKEQHGLRGFTISNDDSRRICGKKCIIIVRTTGEFTKTQ